MRTRTANWDHNRVYLPALKRQITNNGGICPKCGRDCYKEYDAISNNTDTCCLVCGWIAGTKMAEFEVQAAQERQEELDRQAEISFARYGGAQ